MSDLPDMRFHDLIHIAVSFMLCRGNPIRQISRFLEHIKVSAAQDFYGNFIPGMKDDAVDLLDKLELPIAVALQQREKTLAKE